jgi:hypothetical protein
MTTGRFFTDSHSKSPSDTALVKTYVFGYDFNSLEKIQETKKKEEIGPKGIQCDNHYAIRPQRLHRLRDSLDGQK